MKYTVNWKNGLLEGYSNLSPLRVKFTATETGTKLTGYANRAPVELNFDKVTGRLTGGIGASPLDMTLTNCGLDDFLQYIFLFLKYPWL